MNKNKVMQGNINVNSPLVYDDTMTGALRSYAAANQGKDMQERAYEHWTKMLGEYALPPGRRTAPSM